MALRCDPGSSWRRPAGSRWLLAKQRQPRTPAAEPVEAPQRPALQEVSQFMLMALRCDPGSSWRRPAGSRWLLAKQRQPRTPAAEPVEAPQRPALQEVS